jgi:hypothetical protein
MEVYEDQMRAKMETGQGKIKASLHLLMASPPLPKNQNMYLFYPICPNQL